MTTYLRLGPWPEDERSRCWATGTIEEGVSVYALDPQGQPVAPSGEWAEVDLHERLALDEPKWLVTGDLVGTGHDGEPLLRNLTIVRRWQP